MRANRFAAAISSPDICAHDFNHAWAVNVEGTSAFITNAISQGARVVFFSSDTVYGEIDKLFSEGMDCRPAGEYAVMKQEVENRFFDNPCFKTIRLSYVFSREDKFTEYILKCARRKEEAELFHPFYRAVIHKSDVIEGLLALVRRWDEFPQKIINFGGPEVVSRVEFAECIKNAVLPNLKYKVTERNEEFFRNRPRRIAMQSTILPRLLGRPSHNLIEAISYEFKSK